MRPGYHEKTTSSFCIRENNSIELDTAASELEPQNPNPRGYRGDDVQEDPLEETSEETSVPLVEPSTNDTVAINATDIYSIELAPFTIEVDHSENITEDPGIEEYLFQEMVANGVDNLEEVELEMTVTAVSEGRRRRLFVQELSYTGTATFMGPPVHEEEKVHALQNQTVTVGSDRNHWPGKPLHRVNPMR